MTPSQLKRIAVINVGGIGDNLLFYPVVRAVKQYYPESNVSFILEARSQGAASLMPDVDTVIPIDVQGVSKPTLFWNLLTELRKGQYDGVVSCGSSPFISVLLALSGISCRVGFDSGRLSTLCLTQPAHLLKESYAADMYYELAEAFAFANNLHELPTPLSLPQSITPTDAQKIAMKARLEQRFQEHDLTVGERPLILVHPGVSRVSIEKGLVKRWHPSRWAELMLKLSKTNTVMLIGGPDDVDELTAIEGELPQTHPHILDGIGLTRSLAELADLLTQVDCFVCADSAPMHVAVGVNTPLVAFFGEMEPKRLLPDEPKFRWIREAKPANREHAGYLEIPVEDMLAQVNQLLG
jgi:ADP-heptose:LPS heptosyltransferase